MIKKWYYSNLASRPEKVHAQELVAAVQGFPVGVMERFPAAIENDAMADTMDELADLMIADGFVEWGESMRTSEMFLSTGAANWTALRQLRHVINSGDGAVLSTDRLFPVANFSVIDELIESCPADMKGLYLETSGDPNPYADPPTGYGEEHFRLMAGLMPCGIPGILSNFKGVGWGVYFTLDGAVDFLEAWRAIPSMDRQSVLVYTPCLVSGYYMCNPNVVMPASVSGKGIISHDNPVLVKDHRM